MARSPRDDRDLLALEPLEQEFRALFDEERRLRPDGAYLRWKRERVRPPGLFGGADERLAELERRIDRLRVRLGRAPIDDTEDFGRAQQGWITTQLKLPRGYVYACSARALRDRLRELGYEPSRAFHAVSFDGRAARDRGVELLPVARVSVTEAGPWLRFVALPDARWLGALRLRFLAEIVPTLARRSGEGRAGCEVILRADPLLPDDARLEIREG